VAPGQLLLKVAGSEGGGADSVEGHQQHLFHHQQQPVQQAAYPRYHRLTNGAQNHSNGGQTPANGGGASVAGGQTPANGGGGSVAAASLRPGRPTALQLLPAGDTGQQQRFRDQHSSLASSACSLASPSPPSRGLTTPSRGPATPPAPKGPGRHASPPPSRDVEVVFRRRVSQPPTQPSPQVVYILKIHCKKRLAVFPSTAGMSLTKLSQARNN
jgi:hypothetical protein